MSYFAVIGKNKILFISGFLVTCLWITGYGITVPDSPKVPEVFGPEVEDVEDIDVFGDDEYPDLDSIFYQPVWKNITVTVANQDEKTGILEITSNIMLSITNTNTSPYEISTFYLDDIQTVEITRWKATKYMNSIYKFTPSEYTITCDEVYQYYGNIDYFNSMVIEVDDEDIAGYTIFFDKWVISDSGYFHWENSKGYDFSYNFTHPLTGVIYKMEISDIIDD